MGPLGPVATVWFRNAKVSDEEFSEEKIFCLSVNK